MVADLVFNRRRAMYHAKATVAIIKMQMRHARVWQYLRRDDNSDIDMSDRRDSSWPWPGVRRTSSTERVGPRNGEEAYCYLARGFQSALE